MDTELRKIIADYFDAPDLVEFLGLKTEDIVEAFAEEIEDVLEDIEEMIGLKDAQREMELEVKELEPDDD